MRHATRALALGSIFVAGLTIACGRSGPGADAAPSDGNTREAVEAADVRDLGRDLEGTLDAHDVGQQSDYADAMDAPADSGSDASPPGVTCGFTVPNSVASGLPHAASYDTGVPGLVEDLVTGLTWQRDLVVQSPTLGCTVTVDGFLSCPQRYAVQACSASRMGGYADWRLPSIMELISITDLSATGPSIAGAAFPGTPADAFWSATRVGGHLDLGWLIWFSQGGAGRAFIDDTHLVRCVRGGDVLPSRCYPSGARFTVLGDVVSDAATSLSWRRIPPPDAFNWNAAGSYCTSLGGGFRMPSLNELYSLVDFGKSFSDGLMIDLTTFPVANNYQWTSSTVAGAGAAIWVLDFDDGTPGMGYPADRVSTVRCVR